MMRAFFLALFAWAISASCANAAIAITNIASIAHSTGATTINLTTTAGCSGKVIVMARFGGAVTSIAVSDSRSNTYATASAISLDAQYK